MKSCGKDLVFTIYNITDVIPRNEKFPRNYPRILQKKFQYKKYL